ncbi:T9SS-dependent choice-of-anchor J family protein [Soonwooa buanensis]|nr:choice-of-anchor J domain-containing protein [Soonwooa buanensis]
MTKKLLFAIFALPMLANAQFTEGFEASPEIPTGWTVINGGDEITWSIAAVNSAHSGAQMATIEYSSDAHDDYLVTPAIHVTAGVNDFFSFYGRSRSAQWLENISLKISTTTPTKAAFTTVLDANIAPTTDAYIKYNYDLSAYVGQTIYIAFYSDTQDQFYFDIDDVFNGAAPLCEGVTNVVSSNISTSSAKISWATSATPNATYDIEYGPAGFAQGSGTIVNSATNSTTLTGLSAASKYEAYVRSNCATNGTSAWSSPLSFSTACNANVTFPLTEKFDANTLPVCWSNELVEGVTAWEFVNQNQNATITPKSAPYMAQFSVTNSTDIAKLVMPVMDLSAVNNPALKFSMANVEFFNDIDVLKVYYKTSASGTWTQIGDTYSTEHAAWTDVTLPLPNKSNTYYVAFEGISKYGRGLDIDDVMVGDVANLAVNNTAANKAISVYPNPAKDVVNIKTDKDVNSIQIFSLTGQLVKTIEKNVRTINVSDLKKGVYLLRVKSASQDESFKIIKE